jgi:hypothetical protein
VTIRPRQQLLEIWRSIVPPPEDGAHWGWDAYEEPNSVNAAEKLLCLIYPAYELAGFRFDVPDETAPDVVEALRPLGDRVSIPKRMVEILADHLRTWTAPSGAPRFSAGSYLRPLVPGDAPTTGQNDMDIVTSMSMSLTLSLSSLGFLRSFARQVRRDDLRARIAAVEVAMSRRLTAAMVGLVRSFCVRSFGPASPEGRTLLGMIGRPRSLDRDPADELLRRLLPIRYSLLETLPPLGGGFPELENRELLFECGWAWSVRRGAPEIAVSEDIGPQPPGVADPAPDLYFTVVALDGLMDIFSERTLIRGLLNHEQQRLAQILRLQAELTHHYWSTLARFGDGRWPLEKLPWHTVDGQGSDYFSLLVMSVVVQDLQRRRAGDDDLARTVDTIESLAARAGIPHPAESRDLRPPAHVPELILELRGSETLGPPMAWRLSDFAAILLKRAVQFAGLAGELESRERLMRLAERTLDHLWAQRLPSGRAAGLWHEPSREPLPGADARGPSWYHTERIVESLVAAADMLHRAPPRNARMTEMAHGMLIEAEHLIGQELLNVSTDAATSLHTGLQRMQSCLHRARAILRERPGSAYALIAGTLRELDELDAARQNIAPGV